MSYSVSDLKNDLTGILHGQNLNKVKNIDALIDRSGRDVLSDVDPAETKRLDQLNNAIYDKVYDYQIPTDLKGDRIIDIRPQANRRLMERFQQTYNEEFDLGKEFVWANGGLFTVQWDTGVKSLRIANNRLPGTLLNGCNGATDNGTWAATADAENLTFDTLNKIEGAASLRFDLSGAATTGYVENSTMETQDLTTQNNEGAVFMFVWLPTASKFTSVRLRWGSSSSDYWEVTVTSTQDTTAFEDGWNLLRFDWPSTSTGSPDVTVVDYLQVFFTYDGDAITDVRVDDIISRLGTIYEIEYYSKFIFRSSAGVFQEKVDDDSNIINLDTDTYNLLLYRCAYLAAQQLQDNTIDVNFFKEEYMLILKRYRAKYKSEIIKPSQQYYRMRTRRKSPYGFNDGIGNRV